MAKSNIPYQAANGSITTGEFNQILDSIQSGLRYVDTSGIDIAGTNVIDSSRNATFISGTITKLSGTDASFTNGSFVTSSASSINAVTAAVTSGNSVRSSGTVLLYNAGSINTLYGTAANYTSVVATSGNSTRSSGSQLLFNNGSVNTLFGTSSNYTSGNFIRSSGSQLLFNNGSVNNLSSTVINSVSGNVTRSSGTQLLYANGSVNTFSSVNLTATSGTFSVLSGGNFFATSGTFAALDIPSTVNNESFSPDYVVYINGGSTIGLRTDNQETIVNNGDSATAIQAVIDNASASGLGWIHLQEGTYELSAGLTLNNHMTFTGQGQEFSVFKAGSLLNADMITINSAFAPTTHWRVNFYDMKFNGNATEQTDGNIVKGLGIIQSRFIRCHFEYPYHYGIFLWGASGAGGNFGHNNHVAHCLFDQGINSAGSGWGMYMRNNDENIIAQNEFQYMKYGIYDDTGLNTIASNSFVNSGLGVFVNDASRTQIIGNQFDRMAQEGVRLKGPFNKVIGNNFFNCSEQTANTYSCVYLDFYGNNVVSDNTFQVTSASTKAGVEEVGNASEDTYGYNVISNNHFAELSSVSTIGSAGWGTGEIVETNKNLVYGNLFARSGTSPVYVQDNNFIGSVTLDNSLDVSGAVWLRSTAHVTGNADVTGTLSVSGATTLRSTVQSKGNHNMDGTLDVSGATTFRSTASITGATSVAGDFTASGLANFVSGVQFKQQAYFDGVVAGGVNVSGVNWLNGNKQSIIPTGTNAVVFTDPSGPTNLVLKISWGGSGTLTWSGNVLFPSGTAPSWTASSGAVDVVSFFHDGTNYYAGGVLDFR